MGDSATRTVPEDDLPWSRAGSKPEPDVFQLVIAWALEEPERAGEAAPVTGPCVLGRGSAQASDGAPRVVFHRQRPGESRPERPLGGSRISRLQLRLRPAGDRLEIESVGRSPLVVRGEQVTSASVSAGETFALKNALVIYVTRRRRALPKLRDYPAPAFRFGEPDPHGIVGESAAVWALRDALALAARSAHHVLVTGESGTGKELAAGAIHGLSARAARPLVARNAATFPEGLVDAELFGNAKHYPHSGSPEREGLVGEADGSTLFLDEIGELPPALQAHLLRVLDRDGEHQRLGESRVRRADLRLIAATNRPLDALKHDFAARFAARVRVPGLDERREDIPLLIRHLLRRAAGATPALEARYFDVTPGRPPEPRLDPLLVEALVRHRYTHHLRELERLLWLSLTTSAATFVSLSPEVERELDVEAPSIEDEAAVEIGEAEIRAALSAAKGSATAAAKKLGLKNRFALYRRMKRLGIAPPSDDKPERGEEG